MNRTATILLISLFIVPTLLFGMIASAFYVNSPSVPSFTVQYIDRSYDVPVKYTTTTDPFTGQEVTTSTGGNHVTNRTIEISIKNQPFTPIDLGNGTVAHLYYSIRLKGHFSSWESTSADGYYTKWIVASGSDYTVVTLLVGLEVLDADVEITLGGKEDFQVKAVVGYEYWIPNPYHPDVPYLGNGAFETLGESGWSSTQTVTVGAANPTYTPNVPIATYTPMPIETGVPTQSGNNWTLPQLDLTVLGFAALGVVVAVLLVFLVLLRKRIRVLELKQNGT